jgi:uncharacterized NAD-dependent epimerase/dehydratase family protein
VSLDPVPSAADGTAPQRLVILAEKSLDAHDGKTAFGVLRYGSRPVVAVIDSTRAPGRLGDVRRIPGREDVPIVASVDEALALPEPPDALLIGIAPTGGKLPDAWRRTLLRAIEAGLDIISGLHTFLADDHELAAAAAAGVTLHDVRRPTDARVTAVGRRHLPGRKVVLAVGTDCAIGKMSVMLELRDAAARAGASAAFVATGQTGIMIEGWGSPVDAVVSDFVNGTVEGIVARGEESAEYVLVEGQGSLDHPAYSAVTLGLIHGATPHAMVMCHKPGLAEHDFTHLPDRSFPIAALPGFIELHERIAGTIAPSRVVALALNTSLYPDDDEAREVIDTLARETGLPADDPVRFGPDRLWAAVRERVDALVP